jgi:hypothetical protein
LHCGIRRRAQSVRQCSIWPAANDHGKGQREGVKTMKEKREEEIGLLLPGVRRVLKEPEKRLLLLHGFFFTSVMPSRWLFP